MATLIFDVAAFRLAYPAFASESAYPDATLQLYWDEATCYVSDRDCGRLRGACREQVLNLLTAHIAQWSTQVAAGQNPGVIVQSQIDKITIGLMPPPVKTAFHQWLSTTGYGSRAWALLTARATGGFYVGGLPEGSAFRKVGGVF